MPHKKETGRHAGGRPRKFHESSRPVTLTLPERTLQRLEAMDVDRARAVVKAVDMATGSGDVRSPIVDVVETEKGVGIIIVGPSRRLRSVPWLRLVEVAPGRSLLSVPTGTAIESLEIAILDLLEDLGPGEEEERVLLSRLREKLRSLRHSQAMSKAEIVFVRTR